ncbi:hypothetical protein ScPMuIL_001198 [Solemya velum]
MADDEGLSNEVNLQQRHRKERKELQAQVQKLKHSIPKGDKRKKKEITEQIVKLEAELDQKQEKELEELESTTNEPSKVAEQLESLTTVDSDDVDVAHKVKENKPSRAQKRRDKKAQEEKEREKRIQEETINNLMGSRNVESETIKAILDKKGLQLFEIASDGNCLYNAICHQLQQQGTEASNDSLRKQTADYMRAHQDDFLPFLTKDNGDIYTSEDFEKYCVELEKRPVWGGQLEVKALSHVLHKSVEIVQAEGSSLIIGEEGKHCDSPLCIVYHRHAYGLGEHYNSVQPKSEETVDEFT